MGDPLREKLSKPVEELRDELEKGLRERLLGFFGIDPSTGERRPEADLSLDAPGLDARARIVEVLDHFERSLAAGEGRGAARAGAVHKFVREAAFTHLNRLVALKMLEDDSRRVIAKCLAGGRDAAAFRAFRRAAPEWSQSRPGDEGLAPFLDLVYDELAGELGELFDTGDPRTLLPLPDDTLKRTIERLNDDDLSEVWAKDETLGWVYQLFTTAQMRKASRDKFKSGPPNSEHLAFRNQFYTPRYVVEFLVDNTLGRLWWEMHPESSQRERRRLLCVRPGEKPPAREVRAPSSFRVLDPACGSGHFLLYCFDVLAEIYEEVGVAAADVPELIIGKNLFGIEIDLRAAQIAALGLYLRAKRFLRDNGINGAARTPPPNIVVAQPLPVEDDLWAEFLTGIEDRALRTILESFRTTLKQADEIGALYPIRQLLEEPLRVSPRTERANQPQLALFDYARLARDALAALGRFAGDSRAEPTRRLFATEQRNDIGLVNALLQSYDVVLMNPPFGAPVPSTKERLKKWYPRAGDKTNLYAAFVEQGLGLLRHGGFLGAITDRSGFFITTFQEFREDVVLGMADVAAFADLGFGVLGGADEPAKVEAAAYALRREVSAEETPR